MEWLWLGFGLLAAYAVLSLISSERQRMINNLPKPETPPQTPAEPADRMTDEPIQSIG